MSKFDELFERVLKHNNQRKEYIQEKKEHLKQRKSLREQLAALKSAKIDGKIAKAHKMERHLQLLLKQLNEMSIWLSIKAEYLAFAPEVPETAINSSELPQDISIELLLEPSLETIPTTQSLVESIDKRKEQLSGLSPLERARKYTVLETAIQQYEKDKWVQLVILFAGFVLETNSKATVNIKHLPIDTLLYILSYLPSEFLGDSLKSSMACAQFIMDTRYQLKANLAAGYSFQIREQPNVIENTDKTSITTMNFSWRFFTSVENPNQELQTPLTKEDRMAIDNTDPTPSLSNT